MHLQGGVKMTPNTSGEGDKKDSSLPLTHEAAEQILASEVLKSSVIQLKIW